MHQENPFNPTVVVETNINSVPTLVTIYKEDSSVDDHGITLSQKSGANVMINDFRISRVGH